jgi:hypothetical protein
MDSLVTAAARALAAGDPLGALQRVALRHDPPSLALRGIAMAQLGELGRARQLLQRAARAFGPREALARARCTVAEAEIAMAARELGWPLRRLAAAQQVLEAHGDALNAIHAQLIAARRLLLLGRVAQAEQALAGCELREVPGMLAATRELVSADIALRRSRARAARESLGRARQAAQRAGIPALAVEVEHALRTLEVPSARRIAAGESRLLRLEQVEDVLGSGSLVVDGCRRTVRDTRHAVALAKRPVLFGIARALAEAWPSDVPRDALIARVFDARRPNESHRMRLRVEVGRLRKELRRLAAVRATKHGFALEPLGARSVVVLAPPIDGEDTALLALLADGAAWSTSALALALGSSQRTVQRALAGLEAAGRVRSLGRARARRWLSPPVAGFTTTLLLPSSLAEG